MNGEKWLGLRSLSRHRNGRTSWSSTRARIRRDPKGEKVVELNTLASSKALWALVRCMPELNHCPGTGVEIPIASRHRTTRGGFVNRSAVPNWDDLFDPVSDRPRILVACLGLPRSEREDCVQEAWLALLRKHPDCTLEEPDTQAWLCVVVRKKAIDHHRHRRRHPVQSIEEIEILAAKEPDGIEDEANENVVDESLFAWAIQDALSELKPVNREIFLLHAREGLDYAQIGEIFGLTPAQARDRYCRARGQLRKLLAGEPRCTHVERGGGRFDLEEWGLWDG